MHNQPSVPLNFYSAYCFDLSPTYNAWVKLTAADVHALQEREGFEWRKSDARLEGQVPSLYFYLNHPIQWVCLVGVVVAFDAFEYRFIMMLDDSSGANIEITCKRTKEQNADTKVNAPSTTQNIKNPMLGITAQGNTVDLTGVDVGSVIKIKGSIGTFREVRQIQLERLCKPVDAPTASYESQPEKAIFAEWPLQGLSVPQTKKCQNGTKKPVFEERF